MDEQLEEIPTMDQELSDAEIEAIWKKIQPLIHGDADKQFRMLSGVSFNEEQRTALAQEVYFSVLWDCVKVRVHEKLAKRILQEIEGVLHQVLGKPSTPSTP